MQLDVTEISGLKCVLENIIVSATRPQCIALQFAMHLNLGDLCVAASADLQL